jgi:hypothetical protein
MTQCRVKMMMRGMDHHGWWRSSLLQAMHVVKTKSPWSWWIFMMLLGGVGVVSFLPSRARFQDPAHVGFSSAFSTVAVGRRPSHNEIFLS